LFTNLETETRKLLQVVLFAQPELDERLAKTEFRQLRQRITFGYKLRVMNAHEVQQYIHHRLEVAGYKGVELFPVKTCQKIARVSQGVPRLVNVLCHKMLMLAYGQGHYKMTNTLLKAAVEDTESIEPTSKRSLFIVLSFGVLSVLSLAYYALLVKL